MNTISVFTDGSSRGNPGPGGWGSVLVIQKESQNNDIVVELGGREENTTNNRMELSAAVNGLNKAKVYYSSDKISGDTKIKVFCDSSYVINGITKWIHGWKVNSWKTKTKDDVMNVDLWKGLDDVVNMIGARNIIWEYVGGHIGIAGNERCDEIATSFADDKTFELYDGPLSGYFIKDILNVSQDEVKSIKKKSNSSKSKAKAYSYVSSVGGKIEIHHSWADCERRVKGEKGARYKKSLDANDEKNIIDDFSSLLF